MFTDRRGLSLFLLVTIWIMTNSGSVLGQVPSGNGNGNFLPPLETAVSDDPIKMAVGDLNQDMIPDLVVCTESTAGIQILLGNDDGSFDSTQIPSIAIIEPMREIYLGNFDGDGLLDLLLLSEDSQNFYLLDGIGSGGFQSPELVYQYSDPVTSMKLADLNGDGHPDLVLSSVCGIVGCIDTRILFSDGNGGLTLSALDFPGSSASEIVDVDDDGDLDLILAGLAFPVIGTYLNDGTGTFALGQEVTAAWSLFRLLAVDVMSVDNDGMPSSALDGVVDLIAVPGNADSLLFFIGAGDGIFLEPFAGYTDGEIDSVGDIYVAQLDGAGAPELLYYGYGPDQMMVLHGDGASGFPYATISTYDLPSNPSCMRLSDFNSDGALDVAIASLSSDSISIFLGEVSQERFVRGDVNENLIINIADPVLLLELLFLATGGLVGCLDSMDANDDGIIDISDPVYLLQFLFVSGDPVPVPYPDCGVDPTTDALNCSVPAIPLCPQQP